MSWARIDDRTPNHPKFEDLSDAAWALWIKALCWTYQPEHEATCGFVPRKVAACMLKGGAEAVEAAASELVEARGDSCFGHASGLWVAERDGWRFHDWQQYRPTASRQCFEPGSEAASEAGRLGGLRSAEKRREKFGTAQPKRTPKPASTDRFENSASEGASIAASTDRFGRGFDGEHGSASGAAPEARFDDRFEGKSTQVPKNTSETGTEAAPRSGSEALPEAPVPSRPLPDPLSLDLISGSLLSSDPDPPVRSGSRGRAKGSLVKRQLPQDWKPSDAHEVEAKSLGVSCPGEAQKFRDYCQANGKRYADFEAAFRNWLRRATEYAGAVGQRGPVQPSSSDRIRKELEQLKREESDHVPY